MALAGLGVLARLQLAGHHAATMQWHVTSDSPCPQGPPAFPIRAHSPTDERVLSGSLPFPSLHHHC